MNRKIMFQGTSSNVGKSILTTALCRIYYKRGWKVAPFKAQNMALNSYVTKAGDEIGRAQVAQAEAAGVSPIVQMNPVLLKPTGNQSSQVVLMGKPVGVLSAKEYHTKYSLTALDKVQESLRYLEEHFDLIVIEGAGSPAEVNLKKNDIVNMRIARMTKAPVLLVADIDRGGAIASVVGTLALLTEEERDLVKGIVINKFRGDVKLLQPALDFLEEYTGKPVVGVVPMITDLDIDEEDSVALESKIMGKAKDIQIAIMQTPKISNFTDFDALAYEPDVAIRYVKQGDPIGHPDLIIMPGSKNTVEDLAYLYEHGYVEEIQKLHQEGVPVIGICGGYQMLGQRIYDPDHVESNLDEIAGLGLLPTSTTMGAMKTTHQVTFDAKDLPLMGEAFSDEQMVGYEIHMGGTVVEDDSVAIMPAFTITSRSETPITIEDGFLRAKDHVLGTYIHGLFDNDALRRHILNGIRRQKGLEPLPIAFRYFAHKEEAYDRLADIVASHLDMDFIDTLLEEE